MQIFFDPEKSLPLSVMTGEVARSTDGGPAPTCASRFLPRFQKQGRNFCIENITKYLAGVLLLFFLNIVLFFGESVAQTLLAPSACRTTTIRNTLFFERSRIAHPNDTNIVIGAFIITDDDVPEDNPNRGAHCHFAGPTDYYATNVTMLAVTRIAGDLSKSDIVRLRLVNDVNGDGFSQELQDKSIGLDLPGNCLYSTCAFSTGRAEALFTVSADTPKTILVVADIGPKLIPNANLKISIKAEAKNIQKNDALQISSDFNNVYQTQISNITLNAPQNECTLDTCNYRRGSGLPESSVQKLQADDFLTRYREMRIALGTREVVVALLYVCEGGAALTETIKIQPVSLDISQVRDYPNALACRNSIQPDAFGTRVLRVAVKAQGNTEAIGKLYLYDDANDNGMLFEKGEIVWKTNLGEDETAVFGSLGRPLLGETRPNASPSLGHYAPQTNPATACTPNTPDGASVGCPHLLVITFDVKESAAPGQIVFEISVDVGDLPGEAERSRTSSSNLILNTLQPVAIVVGGADPQGNLRLIKKVAERTGDPLKIDDGDIVYALSQWTSGQPIDGMTLTENDILTMLTWWKRETRLAAANEIFRAQFQKLGDELVFMVSNKRVLTSLVEVYDVSGRLVLRKLVVGHRIVLNNTELQLNGVYLWQVAAQASDGRIYRTRIEKFVLLR